MLRKGTTGVVLPLAAILLRPTRHAYAAILLQVIAFAVTTTVLLIVLGGALLFQTDPRAKEQTGFGVGELAMFALFLLSVPIATLSAATARLASRTRDDRLATLRLLGAATSEVSVITILEAGITALIGAIAGVILYVITLPLVGLLPFLGGPIGVAGAWAGLVPISLVVIAITVLGTTSAIAGLRRVSLTPLGVRTRSIRPPNRTKALVIGLVALGALILAVASIRLLSVVAPFLLMGIVGGSVALINVIGTPMVARRGRAIGRKATDAAHLIAGRELNAHAASAWRRVSGIAPVAFIAVLGGIAMTMITTGSKATTLDSDLRVGILVTLCAGFVLLACSTGVTQAAALLEDRELIVGLDRLGFPERELRKARRVVVMTPLRWAAGGGAVLALIISLPLVDIGRMVSPVSIATIGVAFAAGFSLVLAALAATTPLLRAIRRDAS